MSRIVSEATAQEYRNRPVRGQVWDWNGVKILVTRIARDGSWADIRCRAENGNTWTKRQKLPFREDWQLTTEYVVLS